MKDRFDGHRVYNGCPDSTMQARIDAVRRQDAAMKEKYPDARAVFYPAEGKFLGFNGVRIITDWCVDKSACLTSIVDAMEGAKETTTR